MRKNPLTMVGTLDQCLLFMYRCPVKAVRHLIPKCLEVITYKENAIIGVVVSQLKHIRPWFVPSWMGIGYHHIAYRVYVSFTPQGEAPIQGLYFLRSEADSSLMKQAGNIITDFRFHRADISLKRDASSIHLELTNSEDGLGNGMAQLSEEEVRELPSTSCFHSVEEAMQFLRYEPYGIFYDSERNKVNVVKVIRDHRLWRERPIFQKQAEWIYLNHVIKTPLIHELTLRVDSIPYRWERGKEYDVK